MLTMREYMKVRGKIKMNKLPEKMSELIALAIKDLKACEKLSEVYEINMEFWHNPHNNKCKVCLAGAVMAQTLEASPYAFIGPSEFDDDYEEENIQAKLFALDLLRSGETKDAFTELNQETPDKSLYRKITPYEDSPEKFKQEMIILAADLQEAGL